MLNKNCIKNKTKYLINKSVFWSRK